MTEVGPRFWSPGPLADLGEGWVGNEGCRPLRSRQRPSLPSLLSGSYLGSLCPLVCGQPRPADAGTRGHPEDTRVLVAQGGDLVTCGPRVGSPHPGTICSPCGCPQVCTGWHGQQAGCGTPSSSLSLRSHLDPTPVRFSFLAAPADPAPHPTWPPVWLWRAGQCLRTLLEQGQRGLGTASGEGGLRHGRRGKAVGAGSGWAHLGQQDWQAQTKSRAGRSGGVLLLWLLGAQPGRAWGRAGASRCDGGDPGVGEEVGFPGVPSGDWTAPPCLFLFLCCPVTLWAAAPTTMLCLTTGTKQRSRRRPWPETSETKSQDELPDHQPFISGTSSPRGRVVSNGCPGLGLPTLTTAPASVAPCSTESSRALFPSGVEPQPFLWPAFPGRPLAARTETQRRGCAGVFIGPGGSSTQPQCSHLARRNISINKQISNMYTETGNIKSG